MCPGSGSRSSGKVVFEVVSCFSSRPQSRHRPSHFHPAQSGIRRRHPCNLLTRLTAVIPSITIRGLSSRFAPGYACRSAWPGPSCSGETLAPVPRSQASLVPGLCFLAYLSCLVAVLEISFPIILFVYTGDVLGDLKVG